MSPLQRTDLVALALAILALGLSVLSLAASRNDWPERRQGGGGWSRQEFAP